MSIRLIVTDVDGTILPQGGQISPATREAARRCREAGIPFVIASGRWVGALEHIVRQTGTADQPLIVANGGAVCAPDGTVLREWFMDPEDVRAVYDILRRYDVMIRSYTRDALYLLNTAAMPGLDYAYMGSRDLRVVDDDPAAFEREGLRDVYKLEAVTENAGLRDRLRAELAGTRAVISGSFWRNTEIASAGMGKGVALRWLAEEMGIDPADCMAFGDNTNDLDLLGAVGWPVAVGNATPELKAVARIIAPADAEDGVAQTIMRRVFGEG